MGGHGLAWPASSQVHLSCYNVMLRLSPGSNISSARLRVGWPGLGMWEGAFPSMWPTMCLAQISIDMTQLSSHHHIAPKPLLSLTLLCSILVLIVHPLLFSALPLLWPPDWITLSLSLLPTLVFYLLLYPLYHHYAVTPAIKEGVQVNMHRWGPNNLVNVYMA